MDYADWKALHDGYDAQRTVMYRKMLLEDGDLLEFFKAIYFFVECLSVIGSVSAETASAQLRLADLEMGGLGTMSVVESPAVESPVVESTAAVATPVAAASRP